MIIQKLKYHYDALNPKKEKDDKQNAAQGTQATQEKQNMLEQQQLAQVTVSADLVNEYRSKLPRSNSELSKQTWQSKMFNPTFFQGRSTNEADDRPKRLALG